jgi:hypothetical protein
MEGPRVAHLLVEAGLWTQLMTASKEVVAPQVYSYSIISIFLQVFLFLFLLHKIADVSNDDLSF